jgi:Ca2+/H+ antiporter
MEVLGWILWAAGLVLGLSWAYGVRTYVRTGRGVQQATVNQTMLMLAAVGAVPLVGFSPFHLLWLLPVAFRS